LTVSPIAVKFWYSLDPRFPTPPWVYLYYSEGYSAKEIAKIMGCNIGTVRSRLFYARQQLQGYLSDYLK